MSKVSNLEENICLSRLTTLKVGGPARFLWRIEKKEDLFEAFDFIKKNNLPFFVLGGGSNILIDDSGFLGVVLKMEIKGMDLKIEKGIFLEVGAGENWDEFVAFTVKEGFWGVENLSGIPGTVGASAIQNIGAYGAEVKNVISEVEVFDSEKLEFKILKNKECFFAYRDSIFKKSEGKKFVITKIIFNLSKEPNPSLSYKDLISVFPEGSSDILAIREAVLKIRAQKFPDLSVYGTAGSFFKNIIVDENKFKDFKAKFSDVVAFDHADDKKKISSGWILDKVLSLRGAREGDVGLFQNQSLVLVNYGKAKAEDIKKFSQKIKSLVKEKTDLEIEEEVVSVN